MGANGRAAALVRRRSAYRPDVRRRLAGHDSGVAGPPGPELALERRVAHDEVVVLDYGGQYSQLIARRVRECGVFSSSAPPRRRRGGPRVAPKGLILSGGPASVYADGAPVLDPELLELGIPVLGICYGMQAIVLGLGGKVEGAEVGEFGRSRLTVLRARPAAGRHARRPGVLDEPPRHRLRGRRRASPRWPARRSSPVAALGGHRARHLRDPVPPRGRPHPLRPARADHLPRGRHLRLLARRGARSRSSTSRSATSAPRWATPRSSAA